MAKKNWLRPESVPYPQVWSNFSKTNKNGKVCHFEIQDITEDLFPLCVEFMTKYFMAREPLYTALFFMHDPISVQEQQLWWKQILTEKLSLVCFVKQKPDEKPQIAGINFLYYHHKSHDEEEVELKGAKLRAVWDIVKHVEDQIDRYSLLNVEEYIDEYGLCVHPDYEGIGIATEMLKERSKLGLAVGLNTTFTMFTAIGSQKAALKAGYKQLVEMKYSELADLCPPYRLDVKDTPTIQYAYKIFSDDT